MLVLLAVAIATADARWLLAALVCGYGFAWVGHFFFEKNRPATFQHPLYSFAGDWVMFKDILRRQDPALRPCFAACPERLHTICTREQARFTKLKTRGIPCAHRKNRRAWS